MTDSRPPDPPSAFVARWIRDLAPPAPGAHAALDVAMGRGRHAALLARAGFRTFGVDVRYEVVRDAVASLASRGCAVRGWCADLIVTPLPRRRFDLIVVTRYLERRLFPSLIEALAPGGVVLYETFTEAQRAHGRGPTSPDHLLAPGELPSWFQGLETLFYEEVDEPEAVARLAARTSSSRR